MTAKHAACPLPIRRFDKLWLANKDGCNYLYFKTGKRSEMKFVFLNNCELQNVYLYKKIRFYEIYTHWNNPENLARKYPRKTFSLVLAKSYGSSIDYLMSGMGNDTMFFLQHDKKVIPCDQSETAITLRRQNFPEVTDARCFNFLDGFDFYDSSFEIICADLSLHYFRMDDTLRIQ